MGQCANLAGSPVFLFALSRLLETISVCLWQSFASWPFAQRSSECSLFRQEETLGEGQNGPKKISKMFWPNKTGCHNERRPLKPETKSILCLSKIIGRLGQQAAGDSDGLGQARSRRVKAEHSGDQANWQQSGCQNCKLSAVVGPNSWSPPAERAPKSASGHKRWLIETFGAREQQSVQRRAGLAKRCHSFGPERARATRTVARSVAGGCAQSCCGRADSQSVRTACRSRGVARPHAARGARCALGKRADEINQIALSLLRGATSITHCRPTGPAGLLSARSTAPARLWCSCLVAQWPNGAVEQWSSGATSQASGRPSGWSARLDRASLQAALACKLLVNLDD